MKKTFVVLTAIVFTLLALKSKDPQVAPAFASSASAKFRPDLARSGKMVLKASSAYTYYLPMVVNSEFIPVWGALGLKGIDVQTLAFDPITPSVMYAGTDGQGIYKSFDFGSTWSQMSSGLPVSSTAYIIAVDPDVPQKLYAALSTYPRFYYSENSGQSWIPGDGLQHLIGALLPYPGTSGRLLVGVGQFELSGGQLFRSDTGGLSWTEVLSKQVSARSIVASFQEPSLIYAGGRGIYRSQDGGDTWLQVAADMSDLQVWDIALNPDDRLAAYAATNAGILKTTNGGDDWSSWGSGLPSNDIRKLQINSLHPTVQYAAFYLSGVYSSLDEGNHWRSMNQGLGEMYVNDLLLDASGTRLYAATPDGIWAAVLVNGD